MTTEPVQPELSSVRITVRIVVSVVAVLTVGALTVVAVVDRRSVDGVPVGLVLADVLTLAALGTGRRAAAQWLGLAALVCVVGSTVLGMPVAFDAATTSNVIFVTTYVGICALPRRPGLVWIAVMTAMWVGTASTATLPVPVAGSEVNARWLSLGQLVVSAVWLWVAWHRELDRVRRRDDAARESEQALIGSAAVQERIRVWRDGLVRTHETVLNDIRYVLDTPTLDRGRLARQLGDHTAGGRLVGVGSITVGAVLDDLARSEEVTVVASGAPNVTTLDAEPAAALRVALTETVRNLRRHSGTRSITLAAFADADTGSVTVRVTHDGAGGPGDGPPGIGRGVVLGEALDGVGGRVHEADGRVDLTVPMVARSDPGSPVEASDTGRVVLSAVLAGNAVGGIPFAVLFALTAGPVALCMGLANLTTAVIGARAAVRRRTVTVPVIAVVAVLGAVVPLGVVSFASCRESHVGVIVAVLTGFGATAAIVWAGRARWWWAALGWTAAMVVLVATVPSGCLRESTSAVAAGLAPPVFMAVIFLSLGRAARATERIRDLQRDSAAAQARADAAVELSARLGDSVWEAWALMAAVAAGGKLDDATRHRLRCLDGLIRATIQVDPKTSGGVAGAGYALVASAAARGVPVRVLHLRDSGDVRPLDPAVVADLDRLLVGDGGPAVIQTLTGPGEDVLTVTTTAAAARRAGLVDGADRGFPGGSLSVDVDPDADLAVAMVRRSVAPA